MLTLIAIIITFSIVVFVHELGHFITALKFGVNVESFSLGFGPEILGFNHKGVRYKLSAFPLGGYVKMKGENLEEEQAMEEDSFMAQKPFKRIGILASGPIMNFITGMVIFSILFFITGYPRFQDKPIIGEVQKGSPAAEAGLKKGDKVLAVDSKQVATWTELSSLISEESGAPVELKIKRDNKIMTITATPKINEEIGRALIGITAPFEYVKLGIFGSIWEGLKYTVLLCIKLIQALWLMIAGKMEAAIAGPVGIAKIVSSAAGQGFTDLFHLIALISVNLGFINLFPIPIFDGGHIMFALWEKIKGSPLDAKKLSIANFIGLIIIISLLIFATWQDLVRFFF
ncbi:MAG: RIP metalloprotease RseP [Elusimicrobiota bacterium]